MARFAWNCTNLNVTEGQLHYLEGCFRGLAEVAKPTFFDCIKVPGITTMVATISLPLVTDWIPFSTIGGEWAKASWKKILADLFQAAQKWTNLADALQNTHRTRNLGRGQGKGAGPSTGGPKPRSRHSFQRMRRNSHAAGQMSPFPNGRAMFGAPMAA